MVKRSAPAGEIIALLFGGFGSDGCTAVGNLLRLCLDGGIVPVKERYSEIDRLGEIPGFAVFSVLLGLSGMRYLACLFAPLFLAFLLELADKKADGSRVTGIKYVSKELIR